MRRYPSLTLFVAGLPVVLMLLFVYVFGGTLGAGLGGRPPWAGRRTAPRRGAPVRGATRTSRTSCRRSC